MKKDNESKKRILASLVMGINCVNSFAPMAVAVNLQQPEPVSTKPVKETVAEPEQYTAACYQVLDVVDSAVFGTAEAAFTENVGTAFVSSSVTGETVEVSGTVSVQNISAGGIATNGIISSGGTQNIFSGGTGNVTTMMSGTQLIASSGMGNITTMSGGIQNIIVSGGTGTITTMSGGSQYINSGAEGTITTMMSGTQRMFGFGIGNINTINGGTQLLDYVDGIGNINTMNGGFQVIIGATGNITSMNNGAQRISGGIGNITSMMSGGTQNIYSGGTGTITTMSGGAQEIQAGGTGSVTTMSERYTSQVVAGGTGTITTMNAGVQTLLISGAEGTITTMIGGSQFINPDATGTIVTMSGGSQHIYGFGTGNITVMTGGTQSVAYADATGNIDTMNNGVQYINNHAIGSVNTMNGGNQNIKTGGTGIVTALNAGRQNVEDGGSSLNTSVNGGTLAVFGDSAVIENTTIDAGKIIFNGSSGNYKLSGNFVARGGTVDLTVNVAETPQVPATYETLTIDNLSGNGTNFLMNVDLNSETNGDKLVVQAAAPSAGGLIQVYDKSLVDGTNVVGPKKLLMVTDNSGVTNWTGKALNTGGLWSITPTLHKEGNDWYLFLSDKQILPNDIAQTNIGFANAAYGAWRNAVTDDTLRMRLGDLRYNDAEEGTWARVKAGKMDADGFAGSYQMYQVGIDKKLANTVYGVAIDYMVGSNDYQIGSGENSMTNLSLYATNYHPSGVYSDVVIKAGKYRGDLNINSTNDAADYSAWGYSASYEIGKTISRENGFFIEPEAQLILGKLQGADYTSNAGVSANRDGSTSFLGRIGVVAGRKLSDAGDYYFKASVWREFAGSGDMNLSAVNNFGDKEHMMKDVSHKDTWFELGIGGNVKLAKHTHLYGDIEKTFGADIQKKWQVNAGVRWEF